MIETPTEAIIGQYEPSRDEVQALIKHYANLYNVDVEMSLSIANCESGFTYDAHNPADPNSGSYGTYQFQLATFEMFAEEMEEDLDIHNPEDNIKLANWAFSTGKLSHWSCAKLTGYIE